MADAVMPPNVHQRRYRCRLGEEDVATLEALCSLDGGNPTEMATHLLCSALRAAREEPDVAAYLAERRQPHLRAVG